MTQALKASVALPAAEHDVLAVAVAPQQLEAGEALGFVDVALTLEERPLERLPPLLLHVDDVHHQLQGSRSFRASAAQR